MMTDGTWVYAVTRSEPAGLRGVAGEDVRALSVGGFRVIVGSCSLDEFGEAGLRRNLEDLDWLAATARAHDAVVRRLDPPVVPFRFATVYADDASARAAVEARSAEFREALEFVTGRVELGVTAYAVPPPPPTAVRPASGRDYLLGRKRALEQEEWTAQGAAESAKLVHEALVDVAVAGQSNRPHDPKLTHGASMVLNGTYLVAADHRPTFDARFEECRNRHPELRLEMTGPWPPYSFVRT